MPSIHMLATISHAPRLPPTSKIGVWARLRHALFGSVGNTLLSCVLAFVLGYGVFLFFDWAVLRAVFSAAGGSAACYPPLPSAEVGAGAEKIGACWAVIGEKYRPILFGRYPYAEQWRPLLCSLALLAMLLFSTRPRSSYRALLGAWVGLLSLLYLLMSGGVFGLLPVETALWGGVPLTLLLTLGGIFGAFPLAILLALGRQAKHRLLRRLCTAYIELVRAVPLVSMLFLATFLLPWLLPENWRIDVLLRVLCGIVLFVAAYLAEVIRGGLQAVAKGQFEAAAALGLSAWQTQSRIVLPQAFAATLPALMNHCIGLLKESSLVTIVGLYELTGALSLALSGDPEWRPFYLEGYLFIAMIYWLLCFSLSRYSERLARR
ncbi:MAG: amino acid ABC transporter permease [Pseudomonadota bacterium]